MESERNITNDIITEYINDFYIPNGMEFDILRRDAEENKVPIILKETESFLKVLLKIIKPAKILEIGCAIGYSAMFFAEVSGVSVLTIEKDEIIYDKAVENIKKLGYSDLIDIRLGDGEQVLNNLQNEGVSDFDFVFIDAAKSHYLRFLKASLPLCSPQAVIVSDNVLFRGRVASDIYDPAGKYKTNIKNMRQYVDYICRNDSMDTTIVSIGDGIAISKLK